MTSAMLKSVNGYHISIIHIHDSANSFLASMFVLSTPFCRAAESFSSRNLVRTLVDAQQLKPVNISLAISV